MAENIVDNFSRFNLPTQVIFDDETAKSGYANGLKKIIFCVGAKLFGECRGSGYIDLNGILASRV